MIMAYYPKRYNYPNQRKPSDKLPNPENIPELAVPIMHYTMFGVAPREILGKTEFKKIKKQVQQKANNHCEICGRYIPHTMATKDWVYTHEVYNVNREKREYTLKRYIGICSECHYFIHQGFLETLLNEGIVNQKYVDRVLWHGQTLLASIGMSKIPNTDIDDIYYLSFGGKKYINDFYPDVALKAIERGVNVLHWDKLPKVLPEELYYHP